MTQADLNLAKNPKLIGSLAAMRRAANMARQTAIQTGTGIVVVQGGKRVHITAEQLRMQKA
ncbi:MAG: hypothetical protein AB7F98_09540 [Novosphingobium sp.]